MGDLLDSSLSAINYCDLVLCVIITAGTISLFLRLMKYININFNIHVLKKTRKRWPGKTARTRRRRWRFLVGGVNSS